MLIVMMKEHLSNFCLLSPVVDDKFFFFFFKWKFDNP